MENILVKLKNTHIKDSSVDLYTKQDAILVVNSDIKLDLNFLLFIRFKIDVYSYNFSTRIVNDELLLINIREKVLVELFNKLNSDNLVYDNKKVVFSIDV